MRYGADGHAWDDAAPSAGSLRTLETPSWHGRPIDAGPPAARPWTEGRHSVRQSGSEVPETVVRVRTPLVDLASLDGPRRPSPGRVPAGRPSAVRPPVVRPPVARPSVARPSVAPVPPGRPAATGRPVVRRAADGPLVARRRPVPAPMPEATRPPRAAPVPERVPGRVRRRTNHRAARRRVPLSPIAGTLLVVGIALEAVGLVFRTTGREDALAGLWSMDLPLSVPRTFVAVLFAVAAVAAFLGALRATGRRPWWLAVGLVAAGISYVKAVGTVHLEELEAFDVVDRPVVAMLGSAGIVAVVLATMWWLSRADRRDRRRVLTAFAVYAFASVGLSGTSSLVWQGGMGDTWIAAATFVEESGEVAGGVLVLVAVLVGVAPRVVLPVDWALRRRADAETIDVPEAWGHRAAWPDAVRG